MKRLIIVLETMAEDAPADAFSGAALARAADAHPALQGLLDFAAPDPAALAAELGMVYPYDPEDANDLAEIDLGPFDWFEPSVGLAAVRAAISALRADPGSLRAATYDPALRPAEVLADLDALEHVLMVAQDRETRFRLLEKQDPQPGQSSYST